MRRGGSVTRNGYRTGEKAAGISRVLACRTGRTPVWGDHAPPGLRDASRTRARSFMSLYTQVWTNVFSPPISLVQQAARGENFSRAVQCHNGGVTRLREASVDPIIAHIHLPPWHHTCSNLPKL